MDETTRKVLGEIGESMPDPIKKGVLKTERTGNTEEVMERVLHAEKDAARKQQIKDQLYGGAFKGKERFVQDPKAAEKANKYLEEAIRDKIRRGELRPAGNDPFMDKMRKRMR